MATTLYTGSATTTAEFCTASPAHPGTASAAIRISTTITGTTDGGRATIWGGQYVKGGLDGGIGMEEGGVGGNDGNDGEGGAVGGAKNKRKRNGGNGKWLRRLVRRMGAASAHS